MIETCKCVWCETTSDPPRHGEWQQLPPGWYMLLEDGYESTTDLYACSTSCVDLYSARERVRAEFREAYDDAYRNGRRNESQSETLERAVRVLDKKYGRHWQERFGLVGVHGL